MENHSGAKSAEIVIVKETSNLHNCQVWESIIRDK